MPMSTVSTHLELVWLHICANNQLSNVCTNPDKVDSQWNSTKAVSVQMVIQEKSENIN